MKPNEFPGFTPVQLPDLPNVDGIDDAEVLRNEVRRLGIELVWRTVAYADLRSQYAQARDEAKVLEGLVKAYRAGRGDVIANSLAKLAEAQDRDQAAAAATARMH